jgi:hypothetical protein
MLQPSEHLNQRRAEIAQQLQAFLSRGGKIEQVPIITRDPADVANYKQLGRAANARQVMSAMTIPKRKEMALAMVADGRSQRAAAAHVGVHQKTIARWVRDSRQKAESQ